MFSLNVKIRFSHEAAHAYNVPSLQLGNDSCQITKMRKWHFCQSNHKEKKSDFEFPLEIEPIVAKISYVYFHTHFYMMTYKTDLVFYCDSKKISWMSVNIHPDSPESMCTYIFILHVRKQRHRLAAQ